MRAALVFLALTVPVAAQVKLPEQECSRSFVQKWRNDKDSAIAMLPAQPCMMKTGSGPYVCYKDGCVRANVYLDGN